ncbi:hypothetical protein V6N11_024764 [Hibiscus sabdariffa]|uniref:Chlorophyll a-b binding protein, chloroplastic n=1 Tax=Hibiscus sabdariffa TaxID=183260 RepID=A0ABR2QNC1_9ROSI
MLLRIVAVKAPFGLDLRVTPYWQATATGNFQEEFFSYQSKTGYMPTLPIMDGSQLRLAPAARMFHAGFGFDYEQLLAGENS